MSLYHFLNGREEDGATVHIVLILLWSRALPLPPFFTQLARRNDAVLSSMDRLSSGKASAIATNFLRAARGDCV